jgi:eukaryotic-like serine/threonine-protein kinase
MAPVDARTVGRYAIHGEIASGGMATVYLGRLLGAAGFARTVAIKRMHPALAKDPEFVSMFVDEARLAAQIHHPNVVSTLDVVARDGELFVVMEYVHGESLASLVRSTRARGARLPARVALRIVADVLAGLHAAHEARSDHGEPLGIVHRDVSPQNVLVGAEGVTRIIDFGVAKAAGRLQTTRDGQLKGKISYMSPEQLLGESVDRRSDIYSASVVLWEILTGERLFQGDNEGNTVHRVLLGGVRPPSEVVDSVPREVDAIVLKGLERKARDRFATARDMGHALDALHPAPAHEVTDWVKGTASETIGARAKQVSQVETGLLEATQVLGGGALVPRTRSDVAPAAARLVVRTAEAEGGAPPPRPRRRAVWVVAVAAVGVVTLLYARARSPSPSLSPPPPPIASQTAAAAPPDTAPPAPASAPETTSSSAPASKPVTTARGAARTRAPAAKPPAADTPPRNCNPPFTVDDNGVRTYKRECVAGKP